MNKLEKEILESEMGLYSRVKSDEEISETSENEAPLSEEPEKPDEIPDEEAHEISEQLKIDDEFLGGLQTDGIKGYEYRETLDLSSLSSDETQETSPEAKKERDCIKLYKETVLMLESGEVNIANGITLLKKNAADGHAISYVYLG